MNILIALSSAALAAPPGVGDLVITELMAAPACQYNEWFEVQNVSGSSVDLDGCLLEVVNPETGSPTDHTAKPPPFPTCPLLPAVFE